MVVKPVARLCSCQPSRHLRPGRAAKGVESSAGGGNQGARRDQPGSWCGSSRAPYLLFNTSVAAGVPNRSGKPRRKSSRSGLQLRCAARTLHTRVHLACKLRVDSVHNASAPTRKGRKRWATGEAASARNGMHGSPEDVCRDEGWSNGRKQQQQWRAQQCHLASSAPSSSAQPAASQGTAFTKPGNDGAST